MKRTRKHKVKATSRKRGKKKRVNYYILRKKKSKKNLDEPMRKYDPKAHSLSRLGLDFLECLNEYHRGSATNKPRKNWTLKQWGATMFSVLQRWDSPIPKGLSTDPNDVEAQIEIYSDPLIKPLPKIAYILDYIQTPIESLRTTLTLAGELARVYVPDTSRKALDYLRDEINKLIDNEKIVLHYFDGSKFIAKATNVSAEPWLIAAQLIPKIREEPERLKRCRFCFRFFWDTIKNRSKTHCGRKECIREQKRQSVERVRHPEKTPKRSKHGKA